MVSRRDAAMTIIATVEWGVRSIDGPVGRRTTTGVWKGCLSSGVDEDLGLSSTSCLVLVFLSQIVTVDHEMYIVGRRYLIR
jgi:hypothetical protein